MIDWLWVQISIFKFQIYLRKEEIQDLREKDFHDEGDGKHEGIADDRSSVFGHVCSEIQDGRLVAEESKQERKWDFENTEANNDGNEGRSHAHYRSSDKEEKPPAIIEAFQKAVSTLQAYDSEQHDETQLPQGDVGAVRQGPDYGASAF